MATLLGRFQQLAKPASEWSAADPVLMLGELGIADPGSSEPVIKCGDGVRPYSTLPSITAGAGGGASPDYVVGLTTTLPPGSAATVVINNAVNPPTISFGIPEGEAGPEGDPGPANSLAIGTVTTGAAGGAAAATITGTPPAQILSLTIPQGIQGIQGIQGEPGPSAFADPSATIGLAAVPGISTNALRADGAPALSQAIVPTWTGAHTFNATVNLAGPLQTSGVDGISGQVLSSQGAGLPATWRTASGGSIELGYNFNTATTAANPGSQKLSFNNAAFAATTSIYFNITAFANFDASTILSLLQAGNRIYIQQRNDASKACVYQVTGPATNNTGWWTVPVTLINSLGTPFPNNADLNCVFILSTSASASANPTATIGLAVVNGSATTWMRSDAAPPLSQAIVPTWTGIHTWTQPLRASDGSAGAPGVAFANNSNNGLFRPNNHTLAFATNGVEVGRFLEGGLFQITGPNPSSFMGTLREAPGIELSVGGSAAAFVAFNRFAGSYIPLSINAASITSNTTITAAAFNVSSARALKRETGTPRASANILARLRPLLYRLLQGDGREQLGLVAEEVQAVCPQLSDGKAVAYDRLAILLLAAWQDEHLQAA